MRTSGILKEIKQSGENWNRAGCGPVPWPCHRKQTSPGVQESELTERAPSAMDKTRMKGHPSGCPALVSSSWRDSTSQKPIR